MIKTLVVFEFKDEVEYFISMKSVNELRNENVYVLALMPESQTFLKKLQIPFFNTCNFFCRKGHEHALLQSNKIYNWIESLVRLEDDTGIKSGYKISFLFYTRLIVHYLLWLIEIVERACAELHVEKIICCSRDNRHITDPFLSVTEGYVGKIGAEIAKKLNIEFELFNIPKITQGLFVQNFKKGIQEVVKYFIYHIKFRFLKFQIKNKKIILATSRSYNLGRVLDAFKHTFNNTCIVYLNSIYSSKKGSYLRKLLSSVFDETIQLPDIIATKKKAFLGNLTDVVSRLESEQGVGGVFTYKGIVFKDIVFHKISNDIVPYLCNVYAQSAHFLEFLIRYKPVMIISQMARDINYNLGELASLCKTPSLLISHGSHVPSENEYEMIEWMEHSLGLINTHYQYVAIQSPWAKAFIDKMPITSKQIITGPLLFANISKDRNRKKFLKESLIQEHRDKVILLHTDTPRIRGHFRFYVYQTVDEYISNLNSLIGAVEEIKGLHLIIRFRPKYFLTREHLGNLLIKSGCYSINTDGAFEEYLSLADMLVSYSSTTIEEALQNEVPVLLYDGDGKYCHIKDAQILDRSLKPEVNSCYYVNKEESLKWALQWLLENHFAKEVPVSLWNSHIFNDSDKTELVSYFSNYFAN